MCRSAPNCSPKTFKPQRAQRKLRIVSRSGPPRHSRSTHSWNSWIPRRAFRINKNVSGKMSGNLQCPESSGHFKKSLRNSSSPHKLLIGRDLTWFEGLSGKLNSAPGPWGSQEPNPILTAEDAEVAELKRGKRENAEMPGNRHEAIGHGKN